VIKRLPTGPSLARPAGSVLWRRLATHHSERRRMMMVTISFDRLAVALLLAIGFATTARGGATEGKALYEQKCQMCHSIGGQGGKMADKGGPLDGVGTKRDADWLKKYLADPKAVIPDAKMPKMKLDDKQLDDLVAYMLTLKEPPPAK
jgi:mono/diheme cytochrome c family protein